MNSVVIIRHVIALDGPTPFQSYYYYHMCLKEPSYGRGFAFHFKAKCLKLVYFSYELFRVYLQCLK
jgi:hypothetical protein